MGDHAVTWRQQCTLMGMRLLRPWYIYFPIACIATMIVPLALSVQTTRLGSLTFNPWMPLLGLYLFGVRFHRSHSAVVTCLPVSIRDVARTSWWTDVFLVSLVPLISPIFWFVGQMIETDPSVIRFLPQATPVWGQLPMFLLWEFLFVGTAVWLRHPCVKRYQLSFGAGICIVWSLMPLDTIQWNWFHTLVFTTSIVLTSLSYFKAASLLKTPSHNLLLQKRARRGLSLIHEPVRPKRILSFHYELPAWWTFLQVIGAFLLVVALWRWFNGLFPFDSRMTYALFVVPLTCGWPYDVSVLCSLPIATRSYAFRIASRYLMSCAVVTAVILSAGAVLGEHWSAQNLIMPVLIMGYGFASRLLAWLLSPEEIMFIVLPVAIAATVAILIFTIDPTLFAADPTGQASPGLTVYLAFTIAILAFALGLYGLCECLRNYISVVSLRSTISRFYGTLDDPPYQRECADE